MAHCPSDGYSFKMTAGAAAGGRRMSQELNDVTRALAELLVVMRKSKTDAAAELAITRVADGLVMALGSIERRLDLLERSRMARLH